MRINPRKKGLILLFLILFLISLTSVFSAQSNQIPTLQPSVNQRASSSGNIVPDANTYNLNEAVRVNQKDGTHRIVPVVTGEILWRVIFTALCGTLLAISVIVLSGAYVQSKFKPGEKNPFLSEALPTLIEGITIVYIVVSILLLSVLGITSAEGTLSILAGISGYVLGKERSSKSTDKDKPPSN